MCKHIRLHASFASSLPPSIPPSLPPPSLPLPSLPPSPSPLSLPPNPSQSCHIENVPQVMGFIDYQALNWGPGVDLGTRC